MIQTKEKNLTQTLFPFSEVHAPFRGIEEKPLREAQNSEGLMELPVNNYLKTQDEIELEFRYGIHPGKFNLRRDNLRDVASIMKTDGYLNIHNLDEALSGFMEENY